LARIPQRAIDPNRSPIHNESVRERTSRRHATIPAALLLGALLLALLTAERGPAALPAEQPSLSVSDVVGVPHDSRKRWVDSGAVFDSFVF
jgi:hypothetical protein